jgi:NhaP-type Na+/H+ or K+/H+ antiporter
VKILAFWAAIAFLLDSVLFVLVGRQRSHQRSAGGRRQAARRLEHGNLG